MKQEEINRIDFSVIYCWVNNGIYAIGNYIYLLRPNGKNNRIGVQQSRQDKLMQKTGQVQDKLMRKTGQVQDKLHTDP